MERWDEPAGTAGLAGRDLPAPDVLAADCHISAIARDLRAAGLEGSMDNLRAQVFLALLAGRSPYSLLPPGQRSGAVGHQPGEPGSGEVGPVEVGPGERWPGERWPGEHGPGDRAGAEHETGTLRRDTPGLAGAGGPRLVGSVNLTMPLATWLGLSGSPGEVVGYGALDAADCRDLAARIAAFPASRWCLTLTDVNGHPVAHGCARPGAPGPGAGKDLTTVPAPGAVGGSVPHLRTGPGEGPDHATGPPDRRSAASWLAGIKLNVLASGECGHERESPAYRPPPSLRHLVQIRQRTCSFPGCRRPATRCDEDHTLAYDQGGRTCECNLAPLCRAHHRAKQAHGWGLEQPEPGFLIWTTPSGRTYPTGPTAYPG